ncbi:HpcH/HpaI aldolase/citrate lyase family protein [Gellertiella hungarica]|uniref:Citrate lyase subunit beta/citryl-CoA lyase n=1 Tax=Gellertiella hungarica TaxID=1572859 RepID=A0A7W6J638_9HYPH|nr:CoA ester lyase [Gellertiella hungarica]MBB4065471.1 citrate lyase subunit beta/citryl-CoA lyase [Gellertiella hungarica]
MRITRSSRPPVPRRSALSIPAINQRALDKAATLAADVFILDLEDSVAEARKSEARDNLKRFFGGLVRRDRGEWVIRINGMDTAHAGADLETVLACRPDAVLIPKVESPRDILDVADRLAEADGAEAIRIWAMIETPRAVLNAALIAEAAHTPDARLEAFVIGLNDLRKETGVLPQAGRQHLLPWMMQILLAARAYGLDALDSVSNDFRDLEAFAAECRQGRAMGFDGKMLIHPAQIEAANNAFGPSAEALEEAHRIVSAFAAPEAAGLGVINIDGRMVERLHLRQAEQLIAFADRIASGRDSA